ncbi:MAG: AAA family ATPase, partial [Saprospiraceae bacterium]|nr:AAA family ATPase [Saprospiraceae bacterium]
MKISKIIVSGPECSGKTTLAAMLADRLDAKLVPEISRPLLLLARNNYTPND